MLRSMKLFAGTEAAWRSSSMPSMRSRAAQPDIGDIIAGMRTTQVASSGRGNACRTQGRRPRRRLVIPVEHTQWRIRPSPA